MNIAVVVKSKDRMKLDLYGEGLSLLESDAFSDLYTLNFHLQTLAKKHGISKGLMVIHDQDSNKVNLALANDEQSFFVD